MQELDLSIYQKNFYLEWRMDPDSSQYNTCLTYEINGPLNIQALKRTLFELSNHYEHLRTYFIEENGKIKQVIVDKQDVKVEEYDLTGMDKDCAENKYDRILHDIYNHTFDLHKLPLFRYGLIQLSDDRFILVLNCHHIISDALITVSHTIHYISGKYNELVFKEPFNAEDVPKINDYIDYEKKYYSQDERDKDLAYWQKELCDVPLRIDIPDMRFYKKEGVSNKGESHYFILDLETSNKLKKFARTNRATPFLLLSAVWALLCSRYSGQKDIILHYPINVRPPKFRAMPGCFVNTVLMKINVDQNKTVSEFIKSVVQKRKDTKAYQRSSLSDIVQGLRSSEVYEEGAFNVSIVSTSFGLTDLNLKNCNCPAIPRELQHWFHLDDLALQIEFKDKIGIIIDHNGAVFNDKSIHRLSQNFKKILDQFLLFPDRSLKDLRMLSDKMRKQLLIEWNDTAVPYPKDKTIHQLFEEQVSETPNNIAVIFEDEKLSYKELNEKSNQLARLIRDKYKSQNKKDLKVDSLIGLCVERSLDMIIGMLGILKAGAAYVPLDPDYPQDRLQYMIEDSNEGLIITQTNIVTKYGFLDKLHHDELLLIDSDEVKVGLSKQSVANFQRVSGPNDLAYVIYTSGSTGKPKGAMLEHRGIVNQLTWIKENHKYVSNDIILNLTTYAFDASVRQLFVPLISGARVVIPNCIEAKDIEAWTRLIIYHRVTRFYMVPTALRGFIDYLNDSNLNKESFTSLSMICCGGEALSFNLLTDVVTFFPDLVLLNQYGPTEASANVMQCHANLEVSDANYATPPIGKAIGNINLYVLGNSQELLPIGAPGELYIGGIGLFRGYLNQKVITSECFIFNPFAKELGLSESDRIYKTGDLVRWLPDGNIEYLGRTDFQVKIRGFRVELGEIENVLSQHCDISKVCVSYHKEKKQLACYYVATMFDPGVDALKDYLSETLPDYMVPAAFVKLDEMPLTPNGKINRRALPDPDMGLMSKEYVSPRNEIEEKLAVIWCDILKLEQIGIHDNFFSMGGDSIISIQLVSRARNSDIYFTPKDLFQNPTIAQLAVIDLKGSVIETAQGLVAGSGTLTPLQYQYCQSEYKPTWYQSQLLKINKKLDICLLEEALSKLIYHHDSLRLRFRINMIGDYEQYYCAKDSTFSIKVKFINLSSVGANYQINQLRKQAEYLLKNHLDAVKGPVIMAIVFGGIFDGCDRLLIGIHHLVVDGLSWRIIISDLENIYQQVKYRRPIKLPLKTSSYLDWTRALTYYAEYRAVDHLEYWLRTIGSIEALDISLRNQSEHHQNIFNETIIFDRDITYDLLNKCEESYNTEINDLLLLALTLALTECGEPGKIGFNLKGQGREEAVRGVDVTRTVGWLTSLFPVVLTLPEIKNIRNITDVEYRVCIQSIKEQLRHIPDKGLSFGVLKYCHPDPAVRKKFLHKRMPVISFNYRGQIETAIDKNNGWRLDNDTSGFGVNASDNSFYDFMYSEACELDLNGYISDNNLVFTVLCKSKSLIERFSKLYKQHLSLIIGHCVIQKEVRYSPSDFATTNLSQGKLDKILKDSKVDRIYALSPLQEGMLFHALHAEESDQFCVQNEWIYEGRLDTKALKSAWEGVINHHDVLRTYFIWQDVDNPVQVVKKEVSIPWFYEDLCNLSEKEQTKKLKGHLAKDRQTRFDLSKPCAIKLHLIKLCEDKFHFILTKHHIILDGWCNTIIFKELADRYCAITKGKKPVISQAPSYERYIEFIKSQDKRESDKFWDDKLRGIDSATDIKLQKGGVKLNPNKPIEYLGSVKHIFNVSKTKEFEDFAKSQKVTINSFVQLAWANILSRYSGESNVIYGSVSSGRSHNILGIDKMVGLLINTLPMSIIIDANKSVAEHLEKVHKTVQEVNHYSYCSLSEVQRLSGVSSGDPLFNVLFAFENYPIGEAGEECDLVMKDFRVASQKTNYPVAVVAYITGRQLQINIDYDNECFSTNVVKTLLAHITNFMLRAVIDAEQPIGKVKILEEKERKQILIGWNNTKASYPKDKTIYQIFEEQVNKTPDNIAVIYEDETLSYNELNKKSNQLSRLIREKYKKQNKKDLKPDNLIGLCVERSLDMIIGILGILKAGGAYVPLDPDYPQDRLEYMIKDSHEGLVITQKDIVSSNGFLDKLHHDELLVIDSEEVKAELSKQSSDNLDKISGPDNLAYVIYTSGSTGRPNGVQQEQGSCVNRISWMQKEYKLKSGETYLHKTPIGFDVSFGEIFWPLSVGGKLIIAKPESQGDLPYLSDLIFKHKIKNIHFVPALLSVFCDYIRENKIQDNLKSLDRVFCSGETLTNDHRSQLLDVLSVQLHNLYGPTESGEISSYDCSQDKSYSRATLPIGKPINNSQFYILDNNLTICPIGAPGELYIGGAGLARGYLNQEELTHERFIPNPFAKELGLSKSDRIYKTGDLVRWLPDGNIEYIGRTDFQVKIRGFRVELGEIENVLAKHKSISQVSVIDKEKEGSKYLAAYYVIAKDKKAPEIDYLRDHLSETLPDYMVPAAFVKLDEMPLTPNGKINRRALPDPDMSLMGEEYVAPRNETEQKLADIWSDVLKINRDIVGIHDNFFNLGGHSLLTIQLISRINKVFDLSVTVAWSFKHVTIAEQAASIEEDESSLKEYQPIIKIKELDGDLPLFLVHPGTAGAEIYLDIGKVFGNKNTLLGSIYGIEYYNLNHLDNPIDDLKLIAKKYIEYMKVIQPKGPYFIGGWSLGGGISYEMAQQLKAEGESVLSVYLIDSRAYGVEPDYTPKVQKQIDQLNKKLDTLRSNGVDEDECQWFRDLGVADDDIEKAKKLQPIEEKLISTYSMNKLDGVEVILMEALKSGVKSSINVEIKNIEQQLFELTKRPNKGLDKFSKNLTVHEFDADHYSIMLDKNHQRRIVKIIEDDMNEKIKAYKSWKNINKYLRNNKQIK